jgi:hypothetical protein
MAGRKPKDPVKKTTFVNDSKRDTSSDKIKGMPSGIYKPVPKAPAAKKSVPAPKPAKKGKPGNFTVRDGRKGAVSAMKKSVRGQNKRSIGTKKAFRGRRPNR